MNGSEILATAVVGGSVTLALGLVLSLPRALRLATRRAVLLSALVVAAIAPAIALAATRLGVGLRASAVPSAIAAAAESVVPAIETAPRSAATPDLTHARNGAPVGSRATAVPRGSPPAEPATAWADVAAILWAAGAALGLMRLGVSVVGIRRVRRSLVPAGDPRAAGTFETAALRVPATLGWARPVVALPAGLADELSDGDLEAILRHEHAHVARRDPLASLAARLARSIHWPNPLAYLAVSRFDATCEELADLEAVRARPRDATRYVACLVRMAERAAGLPVAAGVCSIVGPRRRLTRRVEALLGQPSSRLDGRASLAGRVGALAFGLAAAIGIGCCCPCPARTPRTSASTTADPSRAPRVRQLSPMKAAIDPATGNASPTFTDGTLQVSTDPAYPGKIVVFFEPGTRLDPSTVFQPGDAVRGPTLTGIHVLRFIPGTGNVPLALAPGGVEVADDRVVMTPAALPLPEGQYSIGVFAAVKSVGGAALDPAPVFHSFSVGHADTVPPTIVTTNPVNGALCICDDDDGPLRHTKGLISGYGNGQAKFGTWAELNRGSPADPDKPDGQVLGDGSQDGASKATVGAGVPPARRSPATAVDAVRVALPGPDVVIRFTEAIAAASVTPESIRVVDAGAFVPGGGAPPRISAAPGFPRLKSLGETTSASSDGFEVVWRPDPAAGGFPFGTTVEVTVVGSDEGAGARPVTDRVGNPIERTFRFRFATSSLPTIPAPR